MAWVWLASLAGAADLVIVGERVATVSGPDLTPGTIVVREGKILAIGPSADVEVPDDASVIRGAVVTPGLIDGLSVAGLTGPQNDSIDQDHQEPDLPIAGALRAVDAYTPWDPLVAWLRQHGVTTLNTGPSPGAPIAGRTVITTTAADSHSVIVEDGMLVVTFGEPPKALAGSRTRMGAAAEIRQAFAEAREYRQRRALAPGDRAEVDLSLEPLVQALERQRKVVMVARRADDLTTALRIGQEFGLDMILAGATEAYLVRDEIAAAGVPVLVGPTMARAWSSAGEAHNGTFENPALLARRGIPIGLMTGYEDYVPKVRVVLFEAAIAAANGLGPERALRAVTLGPAEILGLADRKGSLEVGKDADIAVFDGDPFEYASHVCAVVLGGEVVEDRCR